MRGPLHQRLSFLVIEQFFPNVVYYSQFEHKLTELLYLRTSTFVFRM